MRIVGGILKGLRLNPPLGLPVRPTTDMAKEALFNILNNQFDFEEIRVLDLFSGTGSISIEFASRGVSEITSVDKNAGCYDYLKIFAKKYQITAINPVKADVFKFLERESQPYDIIFADPPFDLPTLTTIPEIVFRQNLLKDDGLFIIEHPTVKKLDNKVHFKEQRKYGYSSFSFFSLS
ncbi:MAG TPA: 16S rRNA (guanine(966)-N(2))-methyltransferase RsmD [Sphingobacteriaceae bacterium]|nr:16S rRNA (guanine(966)-N(2))-methyltransferase RsmD [Sphingobacteriaceae bacterium]